MPVCRSGFIVLLLVFYSRCASRLATKLRVHVTCPGYLQWPIKELLCIGWLAAVNPFRGHKSGDRRYEAVWLLIVRPLTAGCDAVAAPGV